MCITWELNTETQTTEEPFYLISDYQDIMQCNLIPSLHLTINLIRFSIAFVSLPEIRVFYRFSHVI